MSRDASIAARRAWWSANPPAASTLGLVLLLLVLLVLDAPRTLVLFIGVAALAIGILIALTRRRRRVSVTAELPQEITPDRARLLLLQSLHHLEGVCNPDSAMCRVARLKTTATVFEIDFAIAADADPAEVRSRVLTRIWHTRQRTLARPAYDSVAALQALDGTPLFVSLPGEIKEEMAASAEVEFWDSGEHVVEQDEPGDSCFIVRRGRLGVYVSNGQSEAQVATLGEGELFGETSLLTGEPRAATVKSEGNAELVRIRASSLRNALKRSPELVQLLAGTAATRSEAVSEVRAALENRGADGATE